MHSLARAASAEAIAPAIAAIAPGTLAAAHLVHAADAARDEATIRVVGLGSGGIFRALDALVAAPFVALPIGTRALRAGLASAIVVALAGALVYAIARTLLARCAAAPRLGPIVAAVVSLTATCGVAYQVEAGGAGGAVLGAALGLAPLAALASFDAPAIAALAAGMALTYEPMVGAAGAVSAIVFALGNLRERRRPDLRELAVIAGAVILGAAPAVAFAIARWRTSGIDALTPLAWAPLGEAGASPPGDLAALAHAEIGWVGAALAAGGAGIAAIVPRARPLAGAIAILGAIGAGGVTLGAPAGPTRYGASALLFVAAALVASGVAMQALVRAVAAARVPYAAASAAMIVVLEVTFPALAVDASEIRLAARSDAIARRWENELSSALAPRAMVLLDAREASRHLVAIHASGALRHDVALVPTTALGRPMGLRALDAEPALAPFFRDMALDGAASEWALSSIASERPIAFAFDAPHDRALARHAVPDGLVVGFRAEPRGALERRRALDALAIAESRLTASFAGDADPELQRITAALLRARLPTFAVLGERDGLLRAAEDVRTFAPIDPRAEVEAATRASHTIAAKPRAAR